MSSVTKDLENGLHKFHSSTQEIFCLLTLLKQNGTLAIPKAFTELQHLVFKLIKGISD